MTQPLIDDVYAPYETGLRKLRGQLGETHPRYADVMLYEQRLSENITQSRLYGDTEMRRTEFNQVVNLLNRLAQDELNVTFNELSGIPSGAVEETRAHSHTRAATSGSEEQLREMVSDPGLRASLTAIRYAVEYIWDSHTTRIVPDGTLHGHDHCQRLSEIVCRLLAVNGGRSLSPHEVYLLLAGIYLHSIGLQCDVCAMPDVRERAEQCGAHFDIPFPRNQSNCSSVDQQKAIRKNYHYLSAAWIDHASRTGETDLGPAAMTIPREMADDLMDVCLHHTRTPINDCPLTFKFNPNGRKQLVAALLRFAYELDVETHRASFTQTATYSLDPRTNVYWWMHNRARVEFVAPNRIRLTISLHPDDAADYGLLVYHSCITEFQSRNAPVLNILAKNGIPIVIAPDSRVVVNEQEDMLPPKVVLALQAMQQGQGPLFELADEVRTWLRAMRYEVSEPDRLDDRTVDMEAAIDLGSVRQRVLVRCIEGQVKPVDVDAMDRKLTRRVSQGWLISDRRVSDLVRRSDDTDSGTEVFNLADFLQQKVWGPYFDALTALVERARIPKLFVDLHCARYAPDSTDDMDNAGKLTRVEQVQSLNDYIDRWLREPGQNHLTVLGECGTGKTWFCRQYAYRQLKCYLKDPAHERLPLLITLRDVANATSMQQLINDTLLEHYHLQFVGSAYEVFQEMNRRGKLLLLLDGFNEVARQSDYQKVNELFWQLTELVQDTSKVILTSRTEYFQAPPTRAALQCSRPGQPTIDLSSPRFGHISLEPFDDEQVHQVITRRLGTDHGAVVADYLLKTPNLAAMTRTPVLIDMLLALADEVDGAKLATPAHVFLYATDRLLLRMIKTQRVFTSPTDKLFFLCELAWDMFSTGRLRLPYSDMPERITTFFAERLTDPDDLDAWDHDLREQSLLHRSVVGSYEFAHKSLVEYFVAFKFAAEIGCLAPVFAETYTRSDTPDAPPAPLPYQRAGVPHLAGTFGAQPLWDAQLVIVRHMLLAMLPDDATDRLWHLLEETRGLTAGQVRFVGGNIATLLALRGEPLAACDLDGLVLAGAPLSELSDVSNVSNVSG